MQPSNVVLLQSNPYVAQTLSTSLSKSFHRVHVATSLDDLRRVAVEHHPSAMVVDLETASLADVGSLKRDFRSARIVCNHRIADEEMWTLSLDVGADDCLPSSDMRGILFATVRNVVDRDLAA